MQAGGPSPPGDGAAEGGVADVLEQPQAGGQLQEELDAETARKMKAQEHNRAIHRLRRKWGRGGASAPTPQVMGAGLPGGPDGPRLCESGCGYVARRGRYRSGRPYEYCCAGCKEIPGQHDGRCRKDPGPAELHDPELAADLAVALQLQLQEVEAYQDRSLQAKITNAMCYVCDPVWGEVEFVPLNADHTKASRWWRILVASIFRECPSCMITFRCCRSQLKRQYTRKEVQRGWRMLIVTWSTFFALVQTAIFAYSLIKYGTASFKENKMIGPPVVGLNTLGAKNTARILTYNEWWRLFTPLLLHSGWLHLLPNLLLQLRIGIMLETLWGHVSWLAIYLLTGSFASLCSCIFMPDTLSVGSSGALCGLLGAWVPFILSTWDQTLPRDVGQRNTQFFMVISTIVLMIPLSFLPLVDFAAHIGGIVMGLACGAVIFADRIQNRKYRIVAAASGLLSAVALFAFVIYWLLDQTNPIEGLLKI